MSFFRTVWVVITMIISMEVYAYETVFSAEQVQRQILSLENQGDTVILLDVDDTIITPKSLTFRSSPHNKIIDEIKANRDQYQNYEEIVSNWRAQRKSVLIDADWPGVLNSLKHGFRIYGLTKVNTGKFGNIKSMEDWRYNELKSHGIEFSEHGEQNRSNIDDQPSFYKGIMMTGIAKKRDTLKKFMSTIAPVDAIVFIDDRVKNLQEIDDFCKENDIQFLGLHFQGLQKLRGRQDEAVYLLQKNTLVKEAKWLSDEEAVLRIKNNS